MTSASFLSVRYVGGPTAVLELAGTRLLLDPTFDPPGEYPIGERVLTKTAPPALAPSELGHIDVVLLSHDQHPDNLDRLGRDYLAEVPAVISAAGTCRIPPPFGSPASPPSTDRTAARTSSAR